MRPNRVVLGYLALLETSATSSSTHPADGEAFELDVVSAAAAPPPFRVTEPVETFEIRIPSLPVLMDNWAELRPSDLGPKEKLDYLRQQTRSPGKFERRGRR